VKVSTTPLDGVLLIEPLVLRDDRGYFLETWSRERYLGAGLPTDWAQDNLSSSVRGTLRGLHAQIAAPQGKLVRVVEGEIWDVALDIRPDSPGLGSWFGVTLSADNFRQLWIPPGFAHGFCVTGECAKVEYKVSAPYDAEDEVTVLWNDPALAIDWPVEAPLLSAKDAAAPTLAELLDRIRA